jgi:hypothetical protein
MRGVSRRSRSLGVAGGLVLLVVVMVLGNDSIGWMSVRKGVGGNLPFVNYPGPKVWEPALLLSSDSIGVWSWRNVRGTLIMMNLLAVWLVTIRLEEDLPTKRRRGVRLGALTRWLAVLLTGASLGCASVLSGMDARGHYRSEIFAAMTIAAELPATLLLYEHLARLARRAGSARMARQFRIVAGVIVALVGTSMLAFATSRHFLSQRDSSTFMILAATQGTLAVGSAAWATSLILTLAGTIAAHSGSAAQTADISQLATVS